MTNYNAKKINDQLGVKLFDENDPHRLRLLKFTKKEVKKKMLDDLIDKNGKSTERLAALVKEILF